MLHHPLPRPAIDAVLIYSDNCVIEPLFGVEPAGAWVERGFVSVLDKVLCCARLRMWPHWYREELETMVLAQMYA